MLELWTMASIDGGSRPFPAIVPVKVQDGDIAVVLFGCKLPLVLRAREGKDNHYELNGAMNCPAIMNGEMLDEYKVVKMLEGDVPSRLSMER